jgi:trans-aconitate methyltransferase
MNDWNPSQYDEHARFVSDYGHAVVDLLDPKPNERILDLGCGDGALTVEMMRRGASVVGVDRSAEMIRAAIALGVDARLMSGDALTFNQEFDAVFTNAALHWIPQADAVIAGVARALRPGGRFVGEFGGHGNVAAITVALRAAMEKRGVACRDFSPWFFPTPENYTKRLVKGGFVVDHIALIPRPTLLPTHMAGWLQTFAGPFFERCQPEDIPGVTEDAVDLLRPALCDDQGTWTADYVRLRFVARLTS